MSKWLVAGLEGLVGVSLMLAVAAAAMVVLLAGCVTVDPLVLDVRLRNASSSRSETLPATPVPSPGNPASELTGS